MGPPFVLIEGWDNVNSHLLLNIMFVCQNGELFLGAIETTWDQKDAQYVCSALVKYIDQVGVDNVVQICMDNISNMQNALLSRLCGTLC
jgi:hypothetical protein